MKKNEQFFSSEPRVPVRARSSTDFSRTYCLPRFSPIASSFESIFSKSGGTPAITKWLDEHLLDATERAAFPNGLPTYDEIQGMFWGEYTRWMWGHAKHLYETDKTQFKIDFGKHVENFRQDRPHEYIKHLLFWIVKGHGKVPCLVFDNADHFNVPFQEEVFNYVYSLYQEVICLVILPITDTTSWQLSKQGPIQSSYTDSFFLPTPPTDLILRRRIEYIEKRIAEGQTESGKKPETGRGYFFSRGMCLEIENIRGFAACLQTVFLNTGQVAEWIGRLANHDIRRCLQFTRETVASPHIHVADLVAANIAKTSMTVNPDDVKMAMIRGKYDIYFQTVQAFVQNLYNLIPEYETTPLLGLSVLQFLESAYAGNEDNDGRYVLIDEIVEYFQAMNVDPRATRACLDAMLTRGLCLSDDPTTQGIKDTVKVEIAPSGRTTPRAGRNAIGFILNPCLKSLRCTTQKPATASGRVLKTVRLTFLRRSAILPSSFNTCSRKTVTSV